MSTHLRPAERLQAIRLLNELEKKLIDYGNLPEDKKVIEEKSFLDQFKGTVEEARQANALWIFNEIYDDGITLLKRAIQVSSVAMTHECIVNGSDVTLSPKNISPLMTACILKNDKGRVLNNLETLRRNRVIDLLLCGKYKVKLNKQEDNRFTPMHLACTPGAINKRAIEKLMEYSTNHVKDSALVLNLNIKDKFGKTPLMRLCSESQYSLVENEAVQLLLYGRPKASHENFKRPIINEIDNQSKNVFHYVCETGNDSLLRLLLKMHKEYYKPIQYEPAGLPVNYGRMDGYTPLHAAIQKLNVYCVEILCEDMPDLMTGMKMNGKDELEVLYVMNNDSTDSFKTSSIKAMIKDIKNYMAKVKDEMENIVMNDRIPLKQVAHLLLRSMRLSMVVHLHIGKSKQSIIFRLCEMGNLTLLKLVYKFIVEYKMSDQLFVVEVNKINEPVTTPFISAVIGKHTKVVEYLFNPGAKDKSNPLDYIDINKKDNDGKTALIYAAINEDVATIGAIIKNTFRENNGELLSSLNITISDKLGKTALEYAKQKKTRDLIRGVKLSKNQQDKVNQDFIDAIRAGRNDLKKVIVSVEAGANINYHQGEALVAASAQNSVDILEFLLKPWYTNPNISFMDIQTPLIAACLNGATNTLKLLLKDPRIEVNKQVQDGTTALMAAAMNGFIKCVQILVDYRGKKGEIVDVYMKNKMNQTAGDMSDTDEIKQIIEARMVELDLAKRSSNETQKLFKQASEGQIDAIRDALKRGLNINMKDSHGRTLLIVALQSGDLSMINFLLKKGADIDIKDDSGMSALDWAIRLRDVLVGHDERVDPAMAEAIYGMELTKRTRQREAIRSILTGTQQKKINKEMANEIRSNGPTKIPEFLDRGADSNYVFIINNLPTTPLISCIVYFKDINMVKQLIDAGADVNKRSKDKTPLMIVAQQKDKEVLKFLRVMLACKDLDVNAKDAEGMTALMYAAQSGNTDIVRELLAFPEIQINNLAEIMTGTYFGLIHFALGNIDVLKLILTNEKVKIDLYKGEKNGMPFTAALCASLNGMPASLKILLEDGAQLDVSKVMKQIMQNTSENFKAVRNILNRLQPLKGLVEHSRENKAAKRELLWFAIENKLTKTIEDEFGEDLIYFLSCIKNKSYPVEYAYENGFYSCVDVMIEAYIKHDEDKTKTMLSGCFGCISHRLIRSPVRMKYEDGSYSRLRYDEDSVKKLFRNYNADTGYTGFTGRAYGMGSREMRDCEGMLPKTFTAEPGFREIIKHRLHTLCISMDIQCGDVATKRQENPLEQAKHALDNDDEAALLSLLNRYPKIKNAIIQYAQKKNDRKAILLINKSSSNKFKF